MAVTTDDPGKQTGQSHTLTRYGWVIALRSPPTKSHGGSSGGFTVFKGCKAHATTSQTVPDNTFFYVNFDTVDFDTGSFLSTESGHTLFTVPTGGAGYYIVGAAAAMRGQTSSFLTLAIELNGSTDVADGTVQYASHTNTDNDPNVFPSTLLSLADGDEIRVYAFQLSGISQDLDHYPVYQPQFWATFVGT